MRFLVFIGESIIERLNGEKAMSRSEEFYRTVLDNLFDGVYFVDLEQRITYWNKGAEQISGFSSQEVIGRRCSEQILIHVDEAGKNLCESGCPLAAVMKDGIPRELEVYLYHKDGYHVPVRVRAQPVWNDQGEISGAVEVFCDHSLFLANRNRSRETQRLVDQDELTQVGNRRFSEVKLGAALHTYHQFADPFGILLIDVDNFKRVNERYGHATGDQMLKLVAETLQYSVRTSDYVGRWGGEEFLVILYDVNEPQIQTIAEKLRRLVEHNSLVTEEGEIGVTVSIGGTLVRSGDAVKSIVERADENLQHSKRAGKNRSTIR